jgi:hypothetical protein
MIWTYADAIVHLLDYAGVETSARERRFARRAIQNAYRDIANLRSWEVFKGLGRITANASYDTGTVAYDHAGGAYERMLTLTTGTWPTWAKYGEVLIDNVLYAVEDRKSDSIITLSVNSNPGADVASDTTYEIVRDTYPLPTNVISVEKLYDVTHNWEISFEEHAEWLHTRRYWRTGGLPTCFTIAADPNYLGQMAIRLNRPPSETTVLDFAATLRPRALSLQEYSTGTATATSGSSTVTGSGTAWTSSMVGSIFRPGNDASNAPTGEEGEYPAVWERRVISVETATSLTLDEDADSSLSGVKYTLSDPVEIENGAMLNLFKVMCEREMSKALDIGEKRQYDETYRQALLTAMGADSRYSGTLDSMMGTGRVPTRLRDLRSDT